MPTQNDKDVAGGDHPEAHGFGADAGKIWRNFLLGILALVVVVVGGLWALGRATGALVDRIPTSVDVALGEQLWTMVAPDARRCTDPAPQAYVEGLAEPLIQALGPSEFTLHFTVVDDPEVNAFALPGGFVTVNMGLLKAAQSGDEIAGVLAHEIQHVILRHGTRRVLRELGGRAVLVALLGGTDFQTAGLVGGELLGRAYDREQEQEADARGRELLATAGIDPAAMADFFERLAADPRHPRGSLTLLSTHPDPGKRAELSRAHAEGFTPTLRLPAPGPLRCLDE